MTSHNLKYICHFPLCGKWYFLEVVEEVIVLGEDWQILLNLKFLLMHSKR